MFSSPAKWNIFRARYVESGEAVMLVWEISVRTLGGNTQCSYRYLPNKHDCLCSAFTCMWRKRGMQHPERKHNDGGVKSSPFVSDCVTFSFCSENESIISSPPPFPINPWIGFFVVVLSLKLMPLNVGILAPGKVQSAGLPKKNLKIWLLCSLLPWDRVFWAWLEWWGTEDPVCPARASATAQSAGSPFPHTHLG